MQGSSATLDARKKLTVPGIMKRKSTTPLVMVATYDFPMARLAEEAGVDLLLVGDSLGTVLLGHESTIPVSIDDIVHHTRAVKRGAPNTHVIADMPFLSAHGEISTTFTCAGRLMQDGGADAIKIEGGQSVANRIHLLTEAGVPVMGHVGLTPQRAAILGGFRVQGKTLATAKQVIDDARAVADAGAYALVLEAIPAELARIITRVVPIPTIGIGAGGACDGQVLVGHDLLGLEQRFHPKFVKRYANLGQTVREAFAAYAADVRDGAFPGPENEYVGNLELADQLDEFVSR